MESRVLEFSYKCQSLIKFYKNESLILHYTGKGKCHYEQCKNSEANLPSFAPTQPLLKSVSLSRCKRSLSLSD